MKRSKRERSEAVSEKRGEALGLIRYPNGAEEWTPEDEAAAERWHQINYGDPMVDLQLPELNEP